MGACACGEKKPPTGKTQISADQQAKINETTAVVKAEVKEDVKEAIEEAEKAQADETKSPEEKKEAKRKVKKAKKRLSKLEVLERAREVESMTLDDYNTAIRRLHSVTGEDPTNPGKKMCLPEGLEWMTAMLEVLWPSIRKYTEKTMREQVQPAISRAVVAYGVTCDITNFDLGENSPGFGPISARRVEGLNGQPDGGLELSLGITYRSNMSITLSTSVGTIGVQNINFLGTLFIWLRPFVDEMPLCGGVEMAFVNPPTIELDWTGFVGNTMDFSGLQTKVRDIIDSSVASYCVVPNFIAVPMHPSVDPAKLKCPQPEGIMRLTVVGANDLPSTDFGGGCDPYVQIKVGAQTWKTKSVQNTTCPQWEETHDFLVYNQDQWVVVDVLDHDLNASDLIGTVKHLPVNRIVKRGLAEVPLTKDGLPLIGEDTDGDDTPPCTIQLKAQWIEINDSTPANDDRLVSVHISEIKGLPTGLETPLKIKASVGTSEGLTKGGVAKPGSWSDSEEVLRLIRTQKGIPAAEVASMLSLEGNEELIERALAQHDDEWLLQADSSMASWWMKNSYLLNWQAFPTEQDAEKDDRVQWAGSSEETNWPLCSKDELNKRKAYFTAAADVADWHYKITTNLKAHKAATEPYYEYVMHMHANSVDDVKLEILNKSGAVVGSTTLTVTDNAVGDEPDLVGPFEVDVNGTKCLVHGSATVKSLVVATELPSNWNLKADAIDSKEFIAWWKDEVYLEDWHYNKEEGTKWTAIDWRAGKKDRASEEELAKRVEYYHEGADHVIGSGVTPSKEGALMACLKAGAITWGDYDVLIGKLRGEPNVPTIAETIEWVNLLIIAMWPNIKAYTETMVRTKVEPQVSKAAKDAGAGMKMIGLDVKLPKVDLGTKPPHFNTIQVEKIAKKNGWGGDYDGMILTLHNASFVSDIDIEVEVIVTSALGTKTMKLGVKNVLFRGTIKTIMKPMLPTLPMIGAVQVTMPNPPELVMDFTGLTDALVDKIPSMNRLVSGTVVNSIAGYCCVPNFIVVPMAPKLIKPVELSYPRPVGVLRVTVESALHLIAGDTSITGAGSSDSYVNIRVGSQTFASEQETSLNPVWKVNNTRDFVIHDMDQCVDMEVFDADGVLGGSDDSLGAVHSKETVIGGGVDLIRRGIPVKALLRLGAKACLALTKKVKDEVSSSDSHVVFESVPVKGNDGQESQLIVTPSWLNIVNDGTRNLAYLLEVQVDEVTGMPSPVERDFSGPFKIKATIGPHNVVSKAGAARPVNVDTAQLLKTIVKMNESGVSLNDISVATELDTTVVEKALVLKDGEEEKWGATANKCITKNKAAENPQFNQRLYQVVPIEEDHEAAQEGRWHCPIELSILSKDDAEIVKTTITYDVASNKTSEGAPSIIHGPFTIPVSIEDESSGGLMSMIGFGSKKQEPYNGKWTVHGSILLEGLKQRVMDAD
eukprot:TRINITY_DN5563_c0_g1_i1.p1 TRINITY_DN5563_c0_g1~~TRINITY_DN5563_c0_g1_i1.p1  ORF type:complete len:1459 (+),score=441.89 TRINITY_DN5563_c0_g1_i1:50-4378(+)